MTEDQKRAIEKAVFDNDYRDMDRLKALGQWPPSKEDKMPFKIEGSVCLATVPPGFEIRYELYDHYPNGDRRYAITVRPMPPEPEHDHYREVGMDHPEMRDKP